MQDMKNNECQLKGFENSSNKLGLQTLTENKSKFSNLIFLNKDDKTCKRSLKKLYYNFYHEIGYLRNGYFDEVAEIIQKIIKIVLNIKESCSLNYYDDCKDNMMLLKKNKKYF